jgi:hypothetical protein
LNTFPKIDHLLTKVVSAEASGQWFEERGFTVTPLSAIASMGIENRLVLFNSGVAGTANFVELMCFQSDVPVQKTMQELLNGASGSRSIVLVSNDAHACADHLRGLGFEPGTVHNVKRQWSLPNETLDLEFDVLLPIQADLTFNVCRYFTLEHYLRPTWTTHANGVSHLSAIFGVVGDAKASAIAYSTILGESFEKVSASHYKVANSAVSLHLFEPSAYEAFAGRSNRKGIAGYELTTKDIDLTFDYINKANTELTTYLGSSRFIEAFGNDVLITQTGERS